MTYQKVNSTYTTNIAGSNVGIIISIEGYPNPAHLSHIHNELKKLRLEEVINNWEKK